MSRPEWHEESDECGGCTNNDLETEEGYSYDKMKSIAHQMTDLDPGDRNDDSISNWIDSFDYDAIYYRCDECGWSGTEDNLDHCDEGWRCSECGEKYEDSHEAWKCCQGCCCYPSSWIRGTSCVVDLMAARHSGLFSPIPEDTTKVACQCSEDCTREVCLKCHEALLQGESHECNQKFWDGVIRVHTSSDLIRTPDDYEDEVIAYIRVRDNPDETGAMHIECVDGITRPVMTSMHPKESLMESDPAQLPPRETLNLLSDAFPTIAEGAKVAVGSSLDCDICKMGCCGVHNTHRSPHSMWCGG